MRLIRECLAIEVLVNSQMYSIKVVTFLIGTGIRNKLLANLPQYETFPPLKTYENRKVVWQKYLDYKAKGESSNGKQETHHLSIRIIELAHGRGLGSGSGRGSSTSRGPGRCC